MKTTALLALALTGITVQAAQPAAAPPPLAPLPSLPTIPPRTNRLASPSAATNLVPSRPARTNLVGLPTNTPAVTGAIAGAAATNISSLTNALAAANTNVTALTNAIGATAARTNLVPLTNAVTSAPRTNIIPSTIPGPITPPPSIPAIVPATTPTLPPGTPVIGAAGPGAAGAVGAAGANPPGANGPELDVLPPGLIKFQDADLALVLELYQDLTGRTVMKPNSLPATKISIRTQTALTRREAIDALNTILAMNQITMINQGEKFVKAVPQAQALTEAEQFNELPGDELNETTRYITQIVQLKNALPKEVAPALAPLARMPGNGIMAIDSSGILVIRDYEENVKRMLELLEKIDVVPSAEFEPIVIPIKYALAADIAQVLGSLTAGGGGGGITVGRQPTRAGLSTGGGGFGQQGGLGGVGGVGGIGGYGGQAGYNPANPLGGASGAGGFGTGGGFGSANAGRSSFADRLRSIVNRTTGGAAGDIVVLGQTKIIADERTNSLLIFAAKEDIKTIKDIIAKLDVVLPQVLIEAIIVEVALDDELKYGFSYLQPPQTSGKFTGLGAINNGQPINFQNFGTTNNVFASGFSYLARWNNDLWVSFEAQANDSRLNVLSRPRIQTSHAVEANLFVGETRPYITSSYAGYPGYGGGAGYSQYSQLQIGITLSVLPLINPDGLVVMDIRQKIQSIGKEVIIDGNPVPSTIDREANAKVSVHDKETVILGGFISSERTKSSSGVPFLKDLPLLGTFFRTQDKKNARRELIVLIRPTVLPTPEIAATAAREETSKMPGVSAARKDYLDAEHKELEKFQRQNAKEAQDAMKKQGFTEPKEQKQTQ